jgi:hypothetical protein
MDWKRLRLILIPSIFGAMAAVVGLHNSGILESPGEMVQVFVYIATGLFVIILLFDVAYHSIKGEGQACPYCGHLRQMKPFRIYGECPNCHK